MHVRLLTEADSAAYRSLRVASIEEASALSSPEIVRELAIYVRIGAGVIAGYALEGSRVWGVFEDARLTGVVAVTCRFGDAAHLWGLYVRPEYRGAKVGPGLMRAAVEWIREQPGVATAKLYVDKCNRRAMQLFLRFGFEAFHDSDLEATQLRVMRLDCSTLGDTPAANGGRVPDPALRHGVRSAAGTPSEVLIDPASVEGRG